MGGGGGKGSAGGGTLGAAGDRVGDGRHANSGGPRSVGASSRVCQVDERVTRGVVLLATTEGRALWMMWKGVWGLLGAPIRGFFLIRFSRVRLWYGFRVIGGVVKELVCTKTPTLPPRPSATHDATTSPERGAASARTEARPAHSPSLPVPRQMEGHIANPQKTWTVSSSDARSFLMYPGKNNNSFPIGQKSCFDKQGDKQSKISHTDMSGGAYLVEGKEHISLFRDHVIADLKGFNKLSSFTEIHTILFPMFFDVDLKIARELAVPEFSDLLVGVIKDVVAKFYPNGNVDVPSAEGSGGLASGVSMSPVLSEKRDMWDWFKVVVCTKHITNMEGSPWRREETCPPVPIGKRVDEWQELRREKPEEGQEDVDVEANEVVSAALLKGVESAGGGDIRLTAGDLKHFEVLKLHSNNVLVVKEPANGTRRFFRPKHRLWHHGLHVHIPDLIVDYSQAAYLRAGVVQALAKKRGEVAAMLKSDEGVRNFNLEWKSIIDEGVYKNHQPGLPARSGGLRMIGAPKASRIGAKGVACVSSRANGGCKLDVCYYWPRYMYEVVEGVPYGALRRVDIECDGSSACYRRLLRMVSVRVESPNRLATPGWINYKEIRLPVDSIANIVRGTNTSVDTGPEPTADEKRMAKMRMCNGGSSASEFLRRENAILDERKLKIIHKIVWKMEKRYKDVTIRARTNNERIIVNMSGEGATFCCNKRDHHSRSCSHVTITAKMRGIAKRPSYTAIIGCFHKGEDAYRKDGKICRNYRNELPLTTEHMTEEEGAVLFPMHQVGSGESNEERMKRCKEADPSSVEDPMTEEIEAKDGKKRNKSRASSSDDLRPNDLCTLEGVPEKQSIVRVIAEYLKDGVNMYNVEHVDNKMRSDVERDRLEKMEE